MKTIYDYSYSGLEELVLSLGWKKYRAFLARGGLAEERKAMDADQAADLHVLLGDGGGAAPGG